MDRKTCLNFRGCAARCWYRGREIDESPGLAQHARTSKHALRRRRRRLYRQMRKVLRSWLRQSRSPRRCHFAHRSGTMANHKRRDARKREDAGELVAAAVARFLGSSCGGSDFLSVKDGLVCGSCGSCSSHLLFGTVPLTIDAANAASGHLLLPRRLLSPWPAAAAREKRVIFAAGYLPLNPLPTWRAGYPGALTSESVCDDPRTLRAVGHSMGSALAGTSSGEWINPDTLTTSGGIWDYDGGAYYSRAVFI